MVRKLLSNIARYMIEHPSSIREIMELVAEYEKHPEKFPRPLIYLAGGWPQDPPPEILREIFRNIIDDDELWKKAARYSPTTGFPDLRELIPVYEKEVFGRHGVSPDMIIVGLGSTEQTAAVFRLLLNANDEIILTTPGYLNYKRQIELEMDLKAKIKYWEIIDDTEFNPSLEKLKNLISSRTKAVLLTSPGNPDGQVWDDDILRGIHDLAMDHGFYVLLDVAYRAFIFGPMPRAFTRAPLEREIWICSFSKELRAPGWRISYLILPEELTRPLNTIEQARVLAPVSPIQLTLIKAFSNRGVLMKIKDFYEAGKRKYEELAKKTVHTLKQIEKIRALEPKGGFYVFFNIEEISRDDKKVWRELIDKKQLALAPGSDFNGARGWLRLSFAPVVENPEKLYEGLKRLQEYFEEIS